MSKLAARDPEEALNVTWNNRATIGKGRAVAANTHFGQQALLTCRVQVHQRKERKDASGDHAEG